LPPSPPPPPPPPPLPPPPPRSFNRAKRTLKEVVQPRRAVRCKICSMYGNKNILSERVRGIRVLSRSGSRSLVRRKPKFQRNFTSELESERTLLESRCERTV
jgi:hypothetical protein